MIVELPTSDRIVKVMSLTPVEFAASMTSLLAQRVLDASPVTAVVGNGTVAISYTSQPGVTLGGLLTLPRAAVVLTFADVTPIERAAFLRRFELAFQRGGG